MLVLSRKLNQEIRIGDNIVVKVIGIKGNQVRLGITAAEDIPVLREELTDKNPPPTELTAANHCQAG